MNKNICLPAFEKTMLLYRQQLAGNQRHSPYFFIEISLAFILSSLVYIHGITSHSFVEALLLCLLILLAMIDYTHYLLPDFLTLSLLWLGLIVNSLGFRIEASQAIMGAVTGYLSLWSIGGLFKILRGKSVIGQGDYKLLAALGAWFGSSALLLIMIVATSIGTIIGVTLILYKKKSWNMPLPFGVFLAFAGFVELLLPV